RFAQENLVEDAPTSAPFLLDTSYDDLLGVPLTATEAQTATEAPVAEPVTVGAATNFGEFSFPASSGAMPGFAATNFSPSSFGNYTYTPPVDIETAQPLTRRA